MDGNRGSTDKLQNEENLNTVVHCIIHAIVTYSTTATVA